MQFFLHIIISAAIFLFPILGYNVVFGKGKILHFGQEAQSIAAVYTLWVLIMQFGHPFWFAFFMMLLLVMTVSCILALLSLRLEPDGLGVMSIALHLMFLAVVLNWQSVTRGALGIPRIPRAPLPTDAFTFAAICLFLLAVWIGFLLWIDKGRIGRSLAALSEHNWHASSLGINRAKIHFIVFCISGLGSCLSALLSAPFYYLLSPSVYGFPTMIFVVMCTVAGGPGSVWGVTLSAFGLMFIREGLRFIDLPPDLVGPIRLLLFGVILLIAVWYRRDTLFPKERSI